jgi:hypothetical protein
MTAAPTGSLERPDGGDALVAGNVAATGPLAHEPRPAAPPLDAPAPVAPVVDATPPDGADAPSILVVADGATVVISVERTLDTFAGATLARLAAAAVDENEPQRLDVDLRALEDYTEDGARALVALRSLGGRLAEGLHFRTGRGPGREALLIAFTEPDDADEPGALGGDTP